MAQDRDQYIHFLMTFFKGIASIYILSNGSCLSRVLYFQSQKEVGKSLLKNLNCQNNTGESQ
jgi:hypothetical protein